MMRKKPVSVSIRISPKAHKKLKLLAIHKGCTIIKLVDSLLKK